MSDLAYMSDRPLRLGDTPWVVDIGAWVAFNEVSRDAVFPAAYEGALSPFDEVNPYRAAGTFRGHLREPPRARPAYSPTGSFCAKFIRLREGPAGAMFGTEVMAAKVLDWHGAAEWACIPCYTTECTHKGKRYGVLVMRRYEETVWDAIIRRGSDREAARAFCAAIAPRIAAVVTALGRAGIVHRDLKMNNFVVDGADDPPSARVAVIDFGFARVYEPNSPFMIGAPDPIPARSGAHWAYAADLAMAQWALCAAYTYATGDDRGYDAFPLMDATLMAQIVSQCAVGGLWESADTEIGAAWVARATASARAGAVRPFTPDQASDVS